MFFIEACYRFLEYLKVVKNSSEHTLRNYAIDLNALKGFLEKELLPHAKPEDVPDKIHYMQSYATRWVGNDALLPLSAIDKALLRRFLAHVHASQCQKNTLIRRISSLRTFFAFVERNAWLHPNPIEDLESPKADKKLPTCLTYEQVQRLLAQADCSDYLSLRDRAAMELFYSSGLRVSELTALNRADFDSTALRLRVRGKGKKERQIPLTELAANWIIRYLEDPERHQEMEHHLAEEDREAIFLNRFGTRLSARSVDRRFMQYLRASGIVGKVTPHTIRHTIARYWLENGMDLKTIQLLLGHSSVSSTTIYTHVSTKLKKKAYDEAHPHA